MIQFKVGIEGVDDYAATQPATIAATLASSVTLTSLVHPVLLWASNVHTVRNQHV